MAIRIVVDQACPEAPERDLDCRLKLCHLAGSGNSSKRLTVELSTGEVRGPRLLVSTRALE
jgi:hypothetical protein